MYSYSKNSKIFDVPAMDLYIVAVEYLPVDYVYRNYVGLCGYNLIEIFAEDVYSLDIAQNTV